MKTIIVIAINVLIFGPMFVFVIINWSVAQGDKFMVSAVLINAGTSLTEVSPGKYEYVNFKCHFIDVQTPSDDPYCNKDYHITFTEQMSNKNGIFGDKTPFARYSNARVLYNFKKGTTADSLMAEENKDYELYLKNKGIDPKTKMPAPEMPTLYIHGKEAKIGDVCCVVVRNYKRLNGKMFRRQYDVFVPDTQPAVNMEYVNERIK